MKKKAYVLGVLSIVTVVSSLVAFIAESSTMLLNAQNTVNEIWGHYTAVAATSTTPGCKEFWISCTSHTVSLETPQSGNVEERGVPTTEQISSWKYDGTKRYIPFVGDTISYGMYPQTNVDDTSLIATLNMLTNPNEFGYYLYNNEYYYKYSATPFKTYFQFDNGTAIVSGTSYWFKVEPIKWKILGNENGIYFVTTESLLVDHRYNKFYQGTESKTDYQGNTGEAYANNYKYSEIRSWLNTDFYNQAFFLDNDNIKVSTVDNSVASTGYSSNPYVCEDTYDKLFLLSAQELTTTNYGFKTSVSAYDTARQCKTTDYARAHGAYTFGYPSTLEYDYINNGYYYTRSPGWDFYGTAIEVNYYGPIGSLRSGNCVENGVRPALRISIDL